MIQYKLNSNVYQAAVTRLEYIFNEFDNIIIAFSGGKDSGVMLNMALEYRKAQGLTTSIGVFHLDYEAQYTATTEYVDAVFDNLPPAVARLRCCVPVKVPTCTSMFETFWRPWEEDKKELWVRELPVESLGPADFDFLTPQMTDYEFNTYFAKWWHERVGAKKTCVLVGLRAEESLDRWRTIVSVRNINKYNDKPWTTKVNAHMVLAYPLYDWTVRDIWTANGRFGWNYNNLYDLMHFAGVPLHAMRVASPFISAGKSSLALYRAIDPNVWGRMVSRVNGVNFTAIYGDTKAMGWRNITKPAHMTWRDYALFLLDTLPQETAEGFRQKLATSIKFWREKGGVLGEDAMNDLRTAGLAFDVGETTNYKTEKRPVRMEYADDVDSKDFRSIPSWKRLCVCILKNDHVGKYMGFTLNKQEMDKRQKALEKYRSL